jgi:hypothetical protein
MRGREVFRKEEEALHSSFQLQQQALLLVDFIHWNFPPE